ncbi:MAG TPA: MMPL family transporter [Steroidobacteraceae bacterium]
MRGSRALALGLWLVGMGLAAIIVARARFSADLSAFLPRVPSPAQRLLVDQLQNGLAARLILIGIEGGDAAQRARASSTLTARLSTQHAFLAVNDGEAAIEERDRTFLFEHRYQLSTAVTAQRFSVAGLRAAIETSLDLISSPAGLLAKSLLRSDPTGETVQVIDQLAEAGAPHSEQGVWSSPDGRRALLLAETRASGSDTDGQAEALGLIRASFAQVAAADAAAPLRLLLSGPAVFAVDARATIEHEVMRLSILSSALIVTLLLLVYRSVTTLLLGLLPVVSGALAGVAAVAIGAGVVHGITLGFGITLIGESVDYSIYLFVQSRRGAAGSGRLEAPARLWPTIGLGVLTSVCGFASLLPSSFPGLAQLGLYSITGLLIAAAVTRLVLPQVLPEHLHLRDLEPFGAAAARLLSRVHGSAIALSALALICVAILVSHRAGIWNRDLAALSPVAASAQALDGQLRSELGAPDISNLVVVTGPDQEAVLQRAETVSRQLDGLVANAEIGGYDNPARYLPSRASQAARLASLPDAATLRLRLAAATSSLPLRAEALDDFVHQVDAARTSLPLERSALEHTSLALAVDALLWHHGGQWYGLLPLRARNAGIPGGDIDIARVRTALASNPPAAVLALNMKQETDALYGGYLREAVRLSLAGLGSIVLLLSLVLRNAVRVARVITPLALAVLVVSATLIASGTELTILHLIGLLLIVAVGSNYALFFDRRASERGNAQLPLTLASLLIANTSTVIGFGVLAFSSVPVLSALGTTVAPGTLLALWFSALLAPRALFAAPAPASPAGQ